MWIRAFQRRALSRHQGARLVTDIRIEDMNQEASSNGTRSTLDGARKIVQGLVERAKKDVGAPFEMDAIAALRALRDSDQAEFERARRELREAKVRMGELDGMLKPPSGKENQETQAEALIRLADQAELFHDVAAVDDGYATVEVSGHRETYRINSKDFKRWLVRRFYEE